MAIEKKDSEVLDAIREHTRLFLKLDFAYIAAGGAVITALKIGRAELIEFGATIAPIATALVFVSLIDVLIFSLVFEKWLNYKTKEVKPDPLTEKFINFCLKAQPFIHYIFVVAVIYGATSFASGSQHQRTIYREQASLQEATEIYMLKNGKPPTSLKQLKVALPKYVPSVFNDDNVRITATGPKSYIILFPGTDGILGNSDDDSATQELSLNEVIATMEADEK